MKGSSIAIWDNFNHIPGEKKGHQGVHIWGSCLVLFHRAESPEPSLYFYWMLSPVGHYSYQRIVPLVKIASSLLYLLIWGVSAELQESIRIETTEIGFQHCIAQYSKKVEPGESDNDYLDVSVPAWRTIDGHYRYFLPCLLFSLYYVESIALPSFLFL